MAATPVNCAYRNAAPALNTSFTHALLRALRLNDLQWVRASGQGTVASFTIVRRGISKAYPAPYVVALIDLEEGPRMMSNIIEAEPEQVSIGAAVSVDLQHWSEGTTLPVFRLLQQGVAE